MRAIELAQEEPWALSDMDAAEDASALGSNSCQHGNSCGRRNSHGTLVQPTNQNAQPDLSQFPPDSLNGWHQALQSLLDQYLTVTFLEEGPVFYVQSWFVNHVLHPVCGVPRTIKIDSQDRLQPGFSVFIHVVQPHPPESDLQSFAEHVIIERQPLPGLAAAVLTAFAVADNDNRLIQRAASLQRWIGSVDVIDALALNHVCEVRRCTAWIGPRPITLVPRNMLYIPPLGSARVTAAESDNLDLRQTPISVRGHLGSLLYHLIRECARAAKV